MLYAFPPQAAAEMPTANRPDSLALVEGLRLFEEGDYEAARTQLLVSALSAGTYIRAESYLYLNALEMELANYDEARVWLEKYHAETLRLLRETADASLRFEAQAARLRRRHDLLVGGMVCIAALVVVATAVIIRRRRERDSSPGDRRILTRTETLAGAGTFAEAGTFTGDHAGAKTETARPSGWEKWMAAADAFRQTHIWAEIVALAGQPTGREARVLTVARQRVLDDELAATFVDFVAILRARCPALTAGDVKLCCLSLAGLSAFGKALCYGSTETNIIKQRKHTIKRKLGAVPHGTELFAFIFDKRNQTLG
ncbi:MAG: hypothetical protein LBR57_02600 [Alistipes sp.]|jgi:hypothetical protein|nr:hypothetical protein [Alistipes sp.]